MHLTFGMTKHVFSYHSVKWSDDIVLQLYRENDVARWRKRIAIGSHLHHTQWKLSLQQNSSAINEAEHATILWHELCFLCLCHKKRFDRSIWAKKCQLSLWWLVIQNISVLETRSPRELGLFHCVHKSKMRLPTVPIFKWYFGKKILDIFWNTFNPEKHIELLEMQITCSILWNSEKINH